MFPSTIQFETVTRPPLWRRPVASSLRRIKQPEWRRRVDSQILEETDPAHRNGGGDFRRNNSNQARWSDRPTRACGHRGHAACGEVRSEIDARILLLHRSRTLLWRRGNRRIRARLIVESNFESVRNGALRLSRESGSESRDDPGMGHLGNESSANCHYESDRDQS